MTKLNLIIEDLLSVYDHMTIGAKALTLFAGAIVVWAIFYGVFKIIESV